jgi:hypothetical protein
MKTEAVKIESRLELFIDRYLIDKLEGAELKMHSPERAPLSLSPIAGGYMTVIKDGDLYRAYYRGCKPGYAGPYDAGQAGGQMITKALTFTGQELVLNYSTSAGGSIGVEIQSAAGRAVPGYSLADCKPMIGDKIEEVVSWRQGSSAGNLSGRPVRLRFVLNDADLYSIRFR